MLVCVLLCSCVLFVVFGIVVDIVIIRSRLKEGIQFLHKNLRVYRTPFSSCVVVYVCVSLSVCACVYEQRSGTVCSTTSSTISSENIFSTVPKGPRRSIWLIAVHFVLLVFLCFYIYMHTCCVSP